MTFPILLFLTAGFLSILAVITFAILARHPNSRSACIILCVLMLMICILVSIYQFMVGPTMIM